MSVIAIEVRPAHHSDFDAVAELLSDFMAEHHRREPEQYRPAILGFTQAIFQTWLEQPNALHIAAEADGKVVGYARAGRWPAEGGTDFTYPNRGVHVGIISVAKEYRHRSVGRALFGAIEAWAIDFDAEYVCLNVSHRNEGARGFYSALGYHPTNEYREKTLRKVKRVEQL